ncbi:MAG: FAD-binding protein [Christensenellales bacterium]|jgi:uncharacterized protein with FMN-binding domain/succinate dehydrogenase/fumarate reductase flavoprotein subunit
MKKWIALLLSVLLTLLAACSPAATPQENTETPGVATATPETAGLYIPGTYSATAKGFGGDVTVTVTVDAEKITDCTVVGDGETAGIGTEAIEQMPARIIVANSAEVDAISGCTVTSNAIKVAAADALNQAMGKEASAVKMKPGTYTATAYGFIAIEPISVKVTVNETSILDIEVDGNRDSVAMVRSVNTFLVPRILEHQSVAVDAISGATATSNAVLTAVTDVLKQALAAGGADAAALSAFQTKEPKTGGSETIDVDVLVVGMGGSGCAAAMSAVEAQAAAGSDISVLAIDKAGRYGGTSAFCGEPMAVNAPKYKAEFNNGEDYMDGAALLAAWDEYTEGDAKMNIVKKFLDNSGDTIDWLFYEHGFLFNNPLTGFGPQDIYRCKYQFVSRFNVEEGRDYGIPIDGGQNTMVDKYFANLMEDYTEMGGRYMLETEATDLIYDEATRTIQGVKAVAHDGTEYTINAKAVILATGGFGGSAELEERFLSENPYFDNLGGYWTLIGMAQNDGKMIASAVDLGAGTYNIDMVPMVHFATSNVVLHDYPVHPTNDGSIDQWYGWDQVWSLNNVPDGLVLCSDIPWIDMQGERFVKEGQLFSWWLAGPSYWAVWSQDRLNDLAEKGFSSRIFTYAQGSQGILPANMPIPEVYDIVEKLVDMGVMVKADSFEELAEKMGVPAATLSTTLNNYEAYCASGTDEQFGKDAAKLLALGEGPYYALKGYSAAFSTVGGLDIDENMNVLLSDGTTPINGLYAVGNDSGGVLYSNKKPYVTYGGAALGWAFTSGRLAGANAVTYTNALGE